MSEIRTACEQDHASPAHLKAFTTKPDTFPHHDWVLCQRLSAALRAPAQTLQTVLDTSLDNLLRNRQLNLLLNVDSHTTRLRIPLGFAAHSSRVPGRQPKLWLCPRSCWSPSPARQTERRFCASRSCRRFRPCGAASGTPDDGYYSCPLRIVTRRPFSRY